jgi:hypothetical protein
LCREEKTMLNVIYEVLAMVPTTFGVAGDVLVSRH